MSKMQIAKEIRAAIKQGYTNKVVTLIGCDREMLDIMTPFGTLLHMSSSHGKLDIVKKLVELGIDINIDGGTYKGKAINEAASNGFIEIVKYLLDCGAELDVSEPEKNPLFAAIYGGHKDIVMLLIEKGIDMRIKYSGRYMKDMDALAFALERGQTEIAKLLRIHLGS